MNPPVLLSATVQHTGTYNLWGMLEASPDVHKITWRDRIRRGLDQAHPTKTTVLHTHFGDETFKDLISHFRELEFWTRALPTVIPLRDPMLAVISRHGRYPKIEPSYIVRGFVQISQLKTEPCFIRTDMPELGRQDARAMFERFDMRPCPDSIITNWRPKNATGQTPLKQAYALKDLGAIEQAVPAAFHLLMEHRNVLRPFLERYGYRDLPWF